MARRVKCKFCGAQSDIDKAYKTVIYNSKGTPSNVYFCNERHRDLYLAQLEGKQQNKQLHNRVCELFSEILGVKKITNTALYKEKAEINEVFSDDVIISYLEENKNWITDAVNKLNGKEYGKIRYVSVILRNNLGDYKPKVKEEKKIIPVMSEEHYETKFKVKTRQGFEDLEDDFDE